MKDVFHIRRGSITVACMLIMAVSLGVVNNCFALYTIPVTEGLNISREQFAVGQTLLFLATMFGSTVVGSALERFSLIRTMRVFALILPAVYFCNSLMTSYTQFLILSFAMGFAETFIINVPLSVLLGKWYHLNIGLALGITFMGSGIGGMVFNPLGSLFIENYGWRGSYRLIAIIMLILLIFLIYVIIREPDETEQDRIRKEGEKRKSGSGMKDRIFEGRSFGEELKRPVLWGTMMLAIILCSSSYTAINFTSTYLQDAGYTPAFAASIAGIVMGAMAVGKILMGRLYDMFGTLPTTFAGCIAMLLSMFSFKFITFTPAVAGVILGAAFGVPLGTVSSPLVTRYFLGQKEFSRKLSFYTAFGNLGGAISPFVAGILYTKYESYLPWYLVTAAMMPAAMLIFLILERNRKVFCRESS